MRIAICDTSMPDIRHFQQVMEAYCQDQGLLCRLEIFTSGRALERSFTPGCYDVIFLDSCTGECSGIDIARHIRRMDEDVSIVFVASSREYALESYDVNAVHYIVKPIDVRSIHEALVRCQRFSKGKRRTLQVMSHRQVLLVPVDKIFYIEVSGKLCTIHCRREIIETYATLDELEYKINTADFLRTHRSYLVNMRYINGSTSGVFRLLNGDLVPIRRNGGADVRRQYKNYLLRQSGPRQGMHLGIEHP